MDDEPGGQISAGGPGWSGVADRTMSIHPSVRFPLDGGSAAPKDGAGHAGSMFQITIGCIDNSIGGFGGDIALHKLKRVVWGKHTFRKDRGHEIILPR